MLSAGAFCVFIRVPIKLGLGAHTVHGAATRPASLKRESDGEQEKRWMWGMSVRIGR